MHRLGRPSLRRASRIAEKLLQIPRGLGCAPPLLGDNVLPISDQRERKHAQPPQMRKPTANLTASRYEFAFTSLKSLASSLPSKIIFDVGPGDGRMRYIESAGFSWRGFDQTAWGDVQRWDLTEPCPTPDASVGAVLLLDVIEHLLNPGLALKNIATVLQPGGRLILTTPNPRWSASRVHNLFRGNLSGFTQRDLDDNHHVFTPWPHIVEKMLHDARLVIDDYVTLDGKTRLLSRPGTLFLPARYILNVVLIVMEKLDPCSCGMSYGLIARKLKP